MEMPPAVAAQAIGHTAGCAEDHAAAAGITWPPMPLTTERTHKAGQRILGFMVIVEAVIETERATGFTDWPVEDPHSSGFLTLTGTMTSVQVGTAMAVLFTYNALSTGPVAAELTSEILRQHLAEAEALIAHGDDLWLGHDPSFRLEHGEGAVGIWSEVGHQGCSQVLVIELAELNHLLADARQQLIGFLTLAEPWATDHVPQLAESLIAALDEHLRITQPLTSSQPFNDPPAIPDSRG